MFSPQVLSKTSPVEGRLRPQLTWTDESLLLDKSNVLDKVRERNNLKYSLEDQLRLLDGCLNIQTGEQVQHIAIQHTQPRGNQLFLDTVLHHFMTILQPLGDEPHALGNGQGLQVDLLGYHCVGLEHCRYINFHYAWVRDLYME